ncbi:hypothetical protein F0562_029487 [Nyssa sinensis]|uniref:Uncharacterized protein n=1 Tax=Nyssa sinensis TaxID=561372 RepID=A0A5J5B2V9_9ASTE|nr:hypothetical protein F0562_029487 [Nyssa sinensis]
MLITYKRKQPSSRSGLAHENRCINSSSERPTYNGSMTPAKQDELTEVHKSKHQRPPVNHHHRETNTNVPRSTAAAPSMALPQPWLSPSPLTTTPVNTAQPTTTHYSRPAA